MATATEIANEVETRVSDISETDFDLARRENAANEAMNRYGGIRSSQAIDDIAGSGVFDLTLPAGFDHVESTILRVEYPAGERTPCYLADSRYVLYDDGSGTKTLRLLSDTPQVGETVKVTYSLPYTLATLPADDFYAVVNLAASVYCEWISTFYAEDASSTLSTDSVDHAEQTKNYAERARRYRDIAYDLLGIDLAAGAEGRERGSGGSGSGGLGAATTPLSETQSYRTDVAKASVNSLTRNPRARV